MGVSDLVYGAYERRLTAHLKDAFAAGRTPKHVGVILEFMDRGDLVPDELVINICKAEMDTEEAKKKAAETRAATAA